jgi:glycosyltransferase involved in cell wall biosynthesis
VSSTPSQAPLSSLAGKVKDRGAPKVVMALENHTYPEDVRVRNEAQELVAAGFAVTVLAPKGKGQSRRDRVEDVVVKRYPIPELDGIWGITAEYVCASLWLTALILNEIRKGASVVHLHNPPDILFPAAGVARLMGRRVIFDHHDLAPELYEQKFGAGAPVALLRWCEQMTMRTAHVVLAANESHRSMALGRGGKRPDEVVVVRNGPRRETVVAQVTGRDHVIFDPRLCFVGSLGTQDGVAALPEVVASLRAKGLDPILTVVGDGPELATIRRRAIELDVLERIEFTGRVPHDEVPALIGRADICLDIAPCNPLNHRSTMIKIGEYMAAGRPVVSYALEETQRTAGDAALYAPAGDLQRLCDLVAELCGDPWLRARLARRAVERVQHLTWEHSAERLRYAYGVAVGHHLDVPSGVLGLEVRA